MAVFTRSVCFWLLNTFIICRCYYIEYLNGNWTLSNNLKGYSIPATVPGSMYTALILSKHVPNLRYRHNDVKFRWIGREDWTYSRSFILSDDQVKVDSVLLVCDGLDTVSKIIINDQLVGTSDNMFVKYTYNVRKFVKGGSNSIVIHFQSAVNFAKARADNSTYRIPPNCPLPVEHGECHVNMIRKEQCSFSVDWGPSFPTQGIWKDIYIQGFNSAVIKDVSATVHKASDAWSINVTVYFDVVEKSRSVRGGLVVRLAGTGVSKSQEVILSKDASIVSFMLHIPPNVAIDEWWPNGYGNQTMYDLSVVFRSNSGSEVSHVKLRIGFRTVELVQQPVSLKDTSKGLTFYFKINGVPVFFKGTNWIPADNFQEEVTKERIRRLLVSAAEVHVNSMRAWGGGVFESDYFYELANELGIMIWQDFMFSISMYPTDELFLHSVRQEITYQVRRLKHHPCIIVWAGNNENEKALRQNWYNTDVDYTRYYKDFITLYIDTVRPIVLSEDSTREFLSSSPSDGLESRRQGWVAKDPTDEHYGDIHYYNYTADFYTYKSFRIPRFASEYGMQAWCDVETLEDVFEEADFDYWGKMAEHRQHHGAGQFEMVSEISFHMKLPDTNNTKQKFKDLVYLTQINQAESIRMETEHYRRWQTDLTPDGRGLTMGALYWQLNDIWQAPSWSSIDYQEKWKMLHYYARKFLSPTLITPFHDNGSLSVFVVVDEVPLLDVRDSKTGNLEFRPNMTSGRIERRLNRHSNVHHLMSKLSSAMSGTLYIQMFSWNNFKPLKTWKVPYKLHKSAELVFRRSMADMMKEAGCIRAQNCFFYLYRESDSQMFSWLSVSYMKDVQGLAKAKIVISDVTQTSPTEFQIKLSSNRIAPYVWLDVYKVKGRFSDNGFLMVKPQTVVKFTAWEPVDLDVFKSSLSVKSLLDIYHHV